MMILVGDTPALDGLTAATGATDDQIIREPLTSEQAAELTKAAGG